MSHTCRIELDGKSHDFPVVEGTENELAIDISTCLLYTSRCV